MGNITLASVETSTRISVWNGYRMVFSTCIFLKKGSHFFWDLKFLWIFFLHMQSAENVLSVSLQLCGMSYKWSHIIDVLSHKDYLVLDHVQVWIEGGQAARELSAVVLSQSGELSLGKITTRAPHRTEWAPSSERTIFHRQHVIMC